jgi:urease accessory protein
VNYSTPILRTARSVLLASSLAILPGMSMAHPGHGTQQMQSSFFSGIAHPLTGVDHLLAMLALGLWLAFCAPQVMQKAGVITAFLTAMAVGCMISLIGVHVPAVEPLIVLSLLVFGLSTATAVRLPMAATASAVGFFALFHGMAHGHEIPLHANAFSYVAGFLSATLLASTCLASSLRPRFGWLLRALGASVAVYGLSLSGMA